MAKTPAPLGAELLGILKGSAIPAEPVAGTPHRPGPDEVAEELAQLARRPPAEERRAMTVRLPLSTLEILRRVAYETQAERQEIVDLALRQLFSRNGY